MAILGIRVLRYQRLEEVEIGKKDMWKSIMTAEFELTAAPVCRLASSKEESFHRSTFLSQSTMTELPPSASIPTIILLNASHQQSCMVQSPFLMATCLSQHCL